MNESLPFNDRRWDYDDAIDIFEEHAWPSLNKLHWPTKGENCCRRKCQIFFTRHQRTLYNASAAQPGKQ
eukprot:5831596-Ditylum_brightwellii.AAC.1